MAQTNRGSVVLEPGRFDWTGSYRRCRNLASVPPPMEEVPPEPPPSAVPPSMPTFSTAPFPIDETPSHPPPSTDTPARDSHRDLPVMTTLPPIPAPPSTTTAITGISRMPSNSIGVGQQHVMGSMNFLAWNCQGSGGSLTSSTMNHLHRLLTSTKAKGHPSNHLNDRVATTTPPQDQIVDFIPDLQKLHTIIKGMRSNATPGPDGLSAAFYKASWDWLKDDIHKVVKDFYCSVVLPTDMNNTFIALIPKKTAPNVPQDFRPISLCNVIYKIIAKSLADILKNRLPDIIHPTQFAFVQGRRISNNIIITQEIVHSFNLKTWQQKAFLLKVDLAKAFDRISWSFISQTLRKHQFNDHFIALLHACISSTSMQVLINGKPSEFLYPTRGIRQGCPLSPYLFAIAINELSNMLQTSLDTNNIEGLTLGPMGPRIHSLLFADDLIICGQGTTVQASAIKATIDHFCQASGQTPNLSKSAILFSRNVHPNTISSIKVIFPVPTLASNTIHLGHPLLFNHKDRNRAYAFIINKFRAKLTTVKANKLNHAGRLTYINSVLASIPIYYLSIVLFSKDFIAKITAIIRRFWWVGVQEDNATTPIPYRSWQDICQSKDNGGLAIRDLHIVNKSLILNAAWRIATEQDEYLSAILKSKYYPNNSFWTANTNTPKSIFWSSILQVKDILSRNTMVQIHQGNSNIWNTPWCDIWRTIHANLNMLVTVTPLPLTINQLWNHLSQTWNVNLISQIFSPQAVQSITQIDVVPSSDNDTLVWKPATNGICTAKNAFSFFNAESQVQLPVQGSRSVSPQAMQLMKRVWKNKTCSPLIKTFIWRLIRRAIATGKRAGTYSTNISQVCSNCNSIENDAHLFFLCNLPRAVWFMANPSICTSSLPHEDDGIQNILTTIITPQTSDDHMLQTLYILWYIWKARNDKRFNNKNWTVGQVHHFANADFHITKTVLQDDTYAHTDEQVTQIFPHQGGAPSMVYSSILQETHAGVSSPTETPQDIFSVQPQPPLFRVQMPAMLQGLRIYTDASLIPDQNLPAIRNAGIGVYLVSSGLHHNFNVHIKASLLRVSSVFTAEATALAFAGIIVKRLQIVEATFLSDNQQLVTYINSSSTMPIPRWDAKFFTQTFCNAAQGNNYKVYKISRNLNSTAHNLAFQARNNLVQNSDVTISCQNATHISRCPFRAALDDVPWAILTHIAVFCC